MLLFLLRAILFLFTRNKMVFKQLSQQLALHIFFTYHNFTKRIKRKIIKFYPYVTPQIFNIKNNKPKQSKM